MIATKRMGGSRTQVSRPENLETGALEGALRTATIAMALCVKFSSRATKPDRRFAAMGRDYSPIWTGASELDFLGCFTTMKAKRRTKQLIFNAK